MLSGEPKSAVERPGDAREETGWQTLMVLQHVDILRETSEFRFHGCLHTRSRTLRQYQAEVARVPILSPRNASFLREMP